MSVENIVAIAGCSYNNEDKSELDRLAKLSLGRDILKPTRERMAETAERERNILGRKFIGHYIVRNGTDLIDNLKFNYLLDGVPICFYEMLNLLKSSVRRAVFVGNSDVCLILQEFKKVFKTELWIGEKDFRFAPEGPVDCWGIDNTISRGFRSFGRDSIVYFMNGDLPLHTDIDRGAFDGDIDNNDVVLDLNGLENIFGSDCIEQGGFPRYYHWRGIDEEGAVHQVKEPNVFLFRYEAVRKIVEEVFESRKSHKGGLKVLFAKKIFGGPINLLSTAFILWRNDIKTLYDLSNSLFDHFFMQRLNGESPAYDTKVLTPKMSAASEIFTRAVGARIKIKAEHTEPGRLEDIDSLEDFALLYSLLQKHPDVYPHQEEKRKFEREGMPRLRDKIRMYGNFPGYFNDYCRGVRCPTQFREDGVFEMNFPQFDIERLDELYRAHKRN